MKKICILGMGYIGLPTASMLANNGYEVLGIDADNKIVEKLNSGKIVGPSLFHEKVFSTPLLESRFINFLFTILIEIIVLLLYNFSIGVVFFISVSVF